MSNATERSRKEAYLQDLAIWRAVDNLESHFSGVTGQIQTSVRGRVHGR